MFDLAKYASRHDHRADTKEAELELARYLLGYGKKALETLKGAGLNHNLLSTECGYQVMRACETLDELGKLPDGECRVLAAAYLQELPTDELLGDHGDGLTLFEAIGGWNFMTSAAGVNDMGEVYAAGVVGMIHRSYKHREYKLLIGKVAGAIQKPGIDIARVMIDAGEMFKMLQEDVCEKAGITIDEATQDALKLHDFIRDQRKANHPRPAFGLKLLDKEFPLMPGTYTGLMANPGGGKTTLALQCAMDSATNGLNVHFISFEMTSAQLGAKRIAYAAGLDVGEIQRGELSDSDREQAAIHQVCSNLEAVFDGTATVTWLKSHLDTIAARTVRPDLVIIDHLHYIEPEGKAREFETLAAASKRIAHFVRTTQVPALVLLQPSGEGTEQTKDNKTGRVTGNKEPSAKDIRGSTSIRHDLSGLIMLWDRQPESSTPKITIKIGKNRFGRECKIDCDFLKAATKFANARQYEAIDQPVEDAYTDTRTPAEQVADAKKAIEAKKQGAGK